MDYLNDLHGHLATCHSAIHYVTHREAVLGLHNLTLKDSKFQVKFVQHKIV